MSLSDTLAYVVNKVKAKTEYLVYKLYLSSHIDETTNKVNKVFGRENLSPQTEKILRLLKQWNDEMEKKNEREKDLDHIKAMTSRKTYLLTRNKTKEQAKEQTKTKGKTFTR